MKRFLAAAFLTAVFLAAVFFVMQAAFHTPLPSLSASLRETTAFRPPDTFEEPGYYYARLNTAEQASYAAIVLNVETFPEEIEIAPLDTEQLGRVAKAITLDHPMLYMFEQGVVLSRHSGKTFFAPQYACTRAEYEAVKQRVAQTVKDILGQLPQGSDYDRELFLHDYLVAHCRYDQTEKAPNNFNPAGALLEGSAICSGYAKAYKLLLDQCGIENVLVTGKTTEDGSEEPVPHIWNAVELSDRWYYVDPTWDDPLTDSKEMETVYGTHNYFNVTDEMLRRTHSEYEFDHPCEDESLFYYRVKNAYLTEETKDAVQFVADLIVAAAEDGNDYIDFKCESDSLCQATVKKLFTQEKIYRAVNLANLRLRHKFSDQSARYSVDETNNRIIILLKAAPND